MSYRHQFSLKGLMIAIGLLAFVQSGWLAKFVSLGSAPLVFLMALIVLDLFDSRRRAADRKGALPTRSTAAAANGESFGATPRAWGRIGDW